MTIPLTLDPMLHDAIATMALMRRRTEVLRAGIERAIADPEYFTLYMRQLDHVLTRPLPDKLRELLPDDREEAVRVSGVRVLSDIEVEQLSLSPYQMSQVQRAVFDDLEEMSDCWVDAINRAADRSLQKRRSSESDIEKIVDEAYLDARLSRWF